MTASTSAAARLGQVTSWWERNQRRALPVRLSSDREHLVRGVNVKVAQSVTIKDAGERERERERKEAQPRL